MLQKATFLSLDKNFKDFLFLFQGPSNHKRVNSEDAKKSKSQNQDDGQETKYELMLTQQQQLLQWQVEHQNKVRHRVLKYSNSNLSSLSKSKFNLKKSKKIINWF